MFDEREVRLLDFDREPGLGFTYLYDFGDDWYHTVTAANGPWSSKPAAPTPPVSDGKPGPAAPEDVGGGSVGYANFPPPGWSWPMPTTPSMPRSGAGAVATSTPTGSTAPSSTRTRKSAPQAQRPPTPAPAQTDTSRAAIVADALRTSKLSLHKQRATLAMQPKPSASIDSVKPSAFPSHHPDTIETDEALRGLVTFVLPFGTVWP
ncbi:IS1096 element passenger TnpR family protein [Methylobacterium oryzae CBMB20]